MRQRLTHPRSGKRLLAAAFPGKLWKDLQSTISVQKYSCHHTVSAEPDSSLRSSRDGAPSKLYMAREDHIPSFIPNFSWLLNRPMDPCESEPIFFRNLGERIVPMRPEPIRAPHSCSEVRRSGPLRIFLRICGCLSGGKDIRTHSEISVLSLWKSDFRGPASLLTFPRFSESKGPVRIHFSGS